MEKPAFMFPQLFVDVFLERESKDCDCIGDFRYHGSHVIENHPEMALIGFGLL